MTKLFNDSNYTTPEQTRSILMRKMAEIRSANVSDEEKLKMMEDLVSSKTIDAGSDPKPEKSKGSRKSKKEKAKETAQEAEEHRKRVNSVLEVINDKVYEVR